MKTTASFAACMACLSPLAAQSVVASLSALTPLSVQVTDGTSTLSSSAPAGPLASFGAITAALGGLQPGTAGVDWSVSSASFVSAVRLTHQLENGGALPTFVGQAGPHQFLVVFAATGPIMADLHITRVADLSPGAPWPTVQIDYDNDGVIDVSSLSAIVPTTVTRPIGTQPLRVRIIVAATLGSATASLTNVHLRLTPHNDLLISAVVPDCFPVVPPPAPFVQASFANRGIDLLVTQNPLEPALMVFGFSAQPQLLNMLFPQPCLLLPRPDIVLYLPNGTLNVPLPASVRPVTFFAQAVTLSQLGPRSSDGFVVAAF